MTQAKPAVRRGRCSSGCSRRVGACLVAGLALLACLAPVPRAQAAASVPVIADVRMASSNLSLDVQLPADAQEATVEAAEALANAPWRPIVSQRVSGGETAHFELPQPAARMFFRVRTRSTPLFPDATSDTLSYQTLASVQQTAQATSAALEVTFRFRLDGSDRIRITRDGVLWEHVNWDWPGTDVTVNGVRWQPRLKNVLMSAGPDPFLPADAAFLGAQVQVTQGRDAVVLERARDALLVLVNDTPPGADDYAFTLRIPRGGAAQGATAWGPPPIQLRLAADIDGSDRLVITRDQATWEHIRWKMPSWVTVNDFDWQPGQHPVLTNAPPTAFLDKTADLATCEVLEREGRDLCAVEATPAAVIVRFADNPNDAALYRLTLGFRRLSALPVPRRATADRLP